MQNIQLVLKLCTPIYVCTPTCIRKNTQSLGRVRKFLFLLQVPLCVQMKPIHSLHCYVNYKVALISKWRHLLAVVIEIS